VQVVRNAALGNTKVLLSPCSSEVIGFLCDNANAAKTYVQLYDAAATGDVTLGTTVPVLTIPMPSSTPLNAHSLAEAIPFRKGIVAVTSTAVDGTGAPGAASCVNILLK
jgi:hypothetical protein